ncbi:MAG: hypothetical protein HY646_20060 [Acidobacteria bacterium]|nr:hypothetical protein [Acidobacteriota bacterium]
MLQTQHDCDIRVLNLKLSDLLRISDLSIRISAEGGWGFAEVIGFDVEFPAEGELPGNTARGFACPLLVRLDSQTRLAGAGGLVFPPTPRLPPSPGYGGQDGGQAGLPAPAPFVGVDGVEFLVVVFRAEHKRNV